MTVLWQNKQMAVSNVTIQSLRLRQTPLKQILSMYRVIAVNCRQVKQKNEYKNPLAQHRSNCQATP